MAEVAKPLVVLSMVLCACVCVCMCMCYMYVYTVRAVSSNEKADRLSLNVELIRCPPARVVDSVGECGRL